jgi:hypothetical protein
MLLRRDLRVPLPVILGARSWSERAREMVFDSARLIVFDSVRLMVFDRIV